MIPKRNTYQTGIIAPSDEKYQPDSPFNGAGWTASLQTDIRKPQPIYNGKEVIIKASKWVTAQKALNLIRSSYTVLSGNSLFSDDEFVAFNDDEPHFDDYFTAKTHKEKYWSTANLPLACAIAARASTKKRWVYAISKYCFSASIFSVCHVDLDPSFGAVHLPVSSFPDDHIRFCYSIISAYSSIEDLGLEIRASARNPSRINGNWNPKVKENLEARLINGKIDLSETLLWIERGPKRKTERKRPLNSLSRASWSYGLNRDVEVNIIDAIARADWLRDCVASHGAKELTSSLSPYDVVNVQHLSRRLILENMGFWGYQQKLMKQDI